MEVQVDCCGEESPALMWRLSSRVLLELDSSLMTTDSLGLKRLWLASAKPDVQFFADCATLSESEALTKGSLSL